MILQGQLWLEREGLYGLGCAVWARVSLPRTSDMITVTNLKEASGWC